ncbi:MAG: hypothetical protein LC799_16480 [Actinobacteria bacterium]|nr:hypothetical protein [Actinomycetota bacterium]
MNTYPAIPRQRQGAQEAEQASRTLCVLTLNPGSTSLKLAVLDGETLRFGHALPDGTSPCWPEFQDLLLRYDPIDAIPYHDHGR